MNTNELESVLAAADPVDHERLERLDLGAMEAELIADLEGVPSGLQGPRPRSRHPRSRRLAFAFAAAALASAIVSFLLVEGGGSGRPASAWGAELVRFAESTPLLLLDEPGWRVQDVYEAGHGPYLPQGSQGEGSMEFITGKPIPDESIRITTGGKSGAGEEGMLPARVRQRKVELSWHVGRPELPEGTGHPIRLPVLGTTALVNTHAGRIIVTTKDAKRQVIEPGGPGDRQMAATWTDGNYVLELHAAVPDLAALEERLSWLKRVDSQVWLDAMPASVVKGADHEAVVREMLKGIPLPRDFRLSLIPDEGITTARTQVGNRVVGTVACLWFRQWGEARRSGDRPAAREAEKAMASSKHWPVLKQMAKEGGSIGTIRKLASEMPSGYREYAGHRWRLLPQAEALGCARWGIPVLPRKQRLQRERRER